MRCRSSSIVSLKVPKAEVSGSSTPPVHCPLKHKVHRPLKHDGDDELEELKNGSLLEQDSDSKLWDDQICGMLHCEILF